LVFDGRRSPKTAVDRASEVFPRLKDLAGRVAGTLSGGEQQMLALSRAYLSKPKVALLDEISMGLAPIVVNDLYNALRYLVADGCSLLIVEQYVNQVLKIADYVYILGRGVIIREGVPADFAGSSDFVESYFDGAG
jgi:branched-chain amino acid transport system ATP-binding protein